MNTIEDCIGAAFLGLALGCLLLLAGAKVYEWLTGKRPRWLDE